ncbi:alpha/beta hydrolase-fold protein [Corynebacterium hesseae]|uniref:Alpha/beta hydrolase-fold protein n=1 Tax=Corynebacterium hesseae TaxID=2913502 RepID=A0ABU9UL26_9CORY|nr:esterase [Corynebacterium aurimucosum]
MNNFIQSVLGLPLTDPVNGGIYIAIVVISALLIAWRLRKRDVVSFLVAAVIATAAYFILKHWDVPFYLFVAGLVPIAAVISLVHHSGRRLVMAVIAVISSLAVAGLTNMEYQSYLDIGSLDPTPVAQEMDYSQFKSIKSSASAAIVRLELPGTTSGFTARQATAYIPPAYWTSPERNLPVLVLLHGNPGGPEQWFGSGEAAETADAFQRANGGLSPIVVAVDATGSETANPICADSSVAKVMTYLATDVPKGIKSAFRVDENQQHWTVAGLSYGGTCSLQILTNHPEAYGQAVDISGEAEPTIGKHADTVAKFYGGDEAAYQAANPAHLLATKKYPDHQSIFIAGNRDAAAVNALSQLSDAAREAGMATYYTSRPGGHSFEVWRPALRETFAWIARRGGLTDITDPFDGVQNSDVHR